MRGPGRWLAAGAVLATLAAAWAGLGLYNAAARIGALPGPSDTPHAAFGGEARLPPLPPGETPPEAPDLRDPALVALGARHFLAACATCHATPGTERSATVRAMRPPPPHVTEAVRRWQAGQLRQIVLNGVSQSGMPGWPAPAREEEVWAVVAYLLAVRDGLSPATQAALATTPATEGPPGAALCSGCHGAIPRHVPRLDIQTEAYLAKALGDYRSGRRPSGIMAQMAGHLPEAALADLAAHFAAQPVRPAAAAPAAPEASEGEALARRGTDDVPACTACHGPGASRARPDHPALAGQDRTYLIAQLRLWREGIRGGSPVMTAAARDLTDADIAALAAWYAALPPRRGPAAP